MKDKLDFWRRDLEHCYETNRRKIQTIVILVLVLLVSISTVNAVLTGLKYGVFLGLISYTLPFFFILIILLISPNFKLENLIGTTAIIIAIFSLAFTYDAFNTTHVSLERSIEIDQNIQQSIYDSLDIKLGLTAAVSKNFLMNKSQYIDGGFVQQKLPTDFESYIVELRISDKELERTLIGLEQNTKRVNFSSEYTFELLFSDLNENMKYAMKVEIWDKESKIIELILEQSCWAKKRLAKLREKQFDNPIMTDYFQNLNQGARITSAPIC
ncbi:MAG: hypothetical protein NUV67_03585 [archaeon]|nr:hypothetical protein [archaeon]